MKADFVKINLKILTVIAAALWISFFTLIAIGLYDPNLRFLCIASAPDGIFALVFTVIAARRWTSG